MDDARKLSVLFVALEAEQRPLLRSGVDLPLHRFGVGHARGLQAALRHEEAACFGNIGLSGALNKQLAPGDLVVARQIYAWNRHGEQICYETDTGLADLLIKRIQKHGLKVHEGALACVTEPLLTPQAKAAMGSQTGAQAVDMESAAIAEAAARLHKPFFCLRVICDPVHRALHDKLLVGVDEQGNNRPGRLLLALLQNPWLLPSFIAMLRDYSQAAGTLTRLGAIISPFFLEVEKIKKITGPDPAGSRPGL